jgi:response regulator NasT
MCRAAPPDLIIADARLPDMDGFQLAAAVGRERPVPVVLAGADPDPEAVWGAAEWHVLGYLAKPPDPRVLGAVVAAAVRSFDRLTTLRDEADQLRQTLEDRKAIERAKGMVMRYTGASEEAAYRRMRRMATDRGQKLVEVARSILAAGEVFAQLVADDSPARHDGRAHGPRPAAPHADGLPNGSAAAGER